MGNRKLATILRCTGLTLLVLGVLALLPATASAASHFILVGKSCNSPKNTCATNDDCSDGLACNGNEICSTTTNENFTDCQITIGNPSDHVDNWDVTEACDQITNPLGPLDCTLLILSTTNTTDPDCAAGQDLGDGISPIGGNDVCTLLPGEQVVFQSSVLIPAAAPEGPLPDQAEVTVVDTCSAGAEGCSDIPNLQHIPASTDVVSGCSPGTTLNCDDLNSCTDDSCVDPAGCVNTQKNCDDSTACTDDSCVAGVCVNTQKNCDDSDACTDDSCVAGVCVNTQKNCDDSDLCTIDSCLAGVCQHEPSGAAECVNEEICRTPGFWGTHGGSEKDGPNITQAVLDQTGPISICGHTISTTDLSNTSAIEAICSSPKGDSTIQLARQLTAAALNCGLTNSTSCDVPGSNGQTVGNVCNGVSIEDVFNACNQACADGFTSPQSGDFAGIDCIGAIDCFNGGGTTFDSATDTCSGDNNGCHDRPLVNGCFDFQNPGPASSPRKCNDARKDDCSIFCSVACTNLVACTD
jgi:hypothetical protein